MFLNHCFMFDSVGVVFDRSVSVCCDASPRAGGYGWTLISGRRLGLLLLFCGLAVLKLHPSSTHKLWRLGASHELQQSCESSSWSVLAVSPAGFCTTEQKGAPRFGDSHMGPALSWWWTSRHWINFMCLKGLCTNSLREELSYQNVLCLFHELENLYIK